MSGELPAPAMTKYLERVLDAAAREFYRRLSEDGELATTRCPRCERTMFPPRLRCPACGGEPGWVPLPRRGTLEAFTTQEAALRFPAPAVLALARIGEVVVPGIARAPYDELRIGEEIEVELRPEPDIGLTLLAFHPLVSARS